MFRFFEKWKIKISLETDKTSPKLEMFAIKGSKSSSIKTSRKKYRNLKT